MALAPEVTAALDRIDKGTYGTCEQCGGPIGHERLEAVPTATRCVTCKAGLPTRLRHR